MYRKSSTSTFKFKNLVNIHIMKKIFSFALVAVLFVACSEEAQDARKYPDTLKGQKARLAEKRQELRALQKEIEAIEIRVDELDTTAQVGKTVLVTTEPVPVKDFQHFVEVQGVITTNEDAAMPSSETGGRIVKMPWKEGDRIRKGQLVAEVDLQSLEKNIEELEKSLTLAKDIYQRQGNLREKNVGSEVDYLQSKNQVETLEKSLERLRLEFKKRFVYAPTSGVVDRVMSKQGEVAGPGAPIIQILNVTDLKVEADVSENYLGAIRRGDQVKIEFPAIGENQVTKITHIGATIDPNNRTFEVETSIKRSSDMIKPNLLAVLNLMDYENKQAPVVPDELILQDVQGKSFVMLLENGKAAKRYVEIGRSFQGETEILNGMKGTETLIVKGARKVSEGDTVKVIAGDTADAKPYK